MNATLPTSLQRARAEGAPGKLSASRPSVQDFDAMLARMGFTEATPEESRMFREAEARVDAQIARQAAAAGLSADEFYRSLLPTRVPGCSR